MEALIADADPNLNHSESQKHDLTTILISRSQNWIQKRRKASFLRHLHDIYMTVHALQIFAKRNFPDRYRRHLKIISSWRVRSKWDSISTIRVGTQLRFRMTKKHFCLFDNCNGLLPNWTCHTIHMWEREREKNIYLNICFRKHPPREWYIYSIG